MTKALSVGCRAARLAATAPVDRARHAVVLGALLLLSLGAQALGGGGLLVAPFAGPSAKRVHSEVREAICESVPCTPDDAAVRRGEVAWGLTAREGVAAVLVGKVEKKRGKWIADLRLYDADGAPLLWKKLPLSKHRQPASAAVELACRGMLKRLNDVEGLASRDGEEAEVQAEEEPSRPARRHAATTDESAVNEEEPSQRRRATKEKDAANEEEPMRPSRRRGVRPDESTSAEDAAAEEEPSRRRGPKRDEGTSAEDAAAEEERSPESPAEADPWGRRSSADEQTRRASPAGRRWTAESEFGAQADAPSRAPAAEDEAPAQRSSRGTVSSEPEDPSAMVEKTFEPPPPARLRGRPVFALEASGWVFSRSFTYQRLSTAELSSLSGSISVAPRVRLELFPFSRLINGSAGGLGVEGTFARSLNQKVVLAEGRFPAIAQEWSAALAWRLTPFGAQGVAFTPRVGGRRLSFSLGADPTSGARPAG
jgi:hypothetical protein